MANPLLRDRDVDFLLYEVLDAERLCGLPAFAEHSRETFDLYLQAARRLAREALFPAYKPMDEAPARFSDGRVFVHPRMKQLYRQMVALGAVNATRPAEVGGQCLPMTIAAAASAYLMAANASAYGFIGLTTGAAHLIEAFGEPRLKSELMTRMYSGEWTGTMALTEPQAGSSLSDVSTTATPAAAGHYTIRGAKIFISGGDHDLTENIVHLVLARLALAPEGIKGVSLFAVPKMRTESGKLVSNDVTVTGAIHKIGWRGLPSLALAFGDRGDCQGWLVGQPNRGLSHMFQMMNEARIMVGMNGVATGMVAYQESLEYARTRPQGRPPGGKDPKTPQVPIVLHADVRRMLLRQKAIVEGGLALILTTARYADLAANAEGVAERHRAALLLDLLTPVAKTFPAEKGFEANALAVQIHGGYGYTSEYLPESWLRDQKLNSIHEGTTGIQGLDLLGRKVVAEAGAPLRLLREEMVLADARAQAAGVDPRIGGQVLGAMDVVGSLTMHLAESALGGDVEAMLLHSADYMELFSLVVIGWQWLAQAAAAKEARSVARGEDDLAFYAGKLCAAQYWANTELPRVLALADLCRAGEDSYAKMRPEWF